MSSVEFSLSLTTPCVSSGFTSRFSDDATTKPSRSTGIDQLRLTTGKIGGTIQGVKAPSNRRIRDSLNAGRQTGQARRFVLTIRRRSKNALDFLSFWLI